MNVVFVLLSYGPDEPAGIERSIVALTCGLRANGHGAHVLAAGPATARDGSELIRLRSLTLGRPLVEDQLLAAIAAAPDLADEVRAHADDLRADLVCWADASWGLGYLAPVADRPTALMVHVVRTDPLFHQALSQQPTTILAPSDYLVRQATDAGLPTEGWRVVPNALLTSTQPPPAGQREQLRRNGPIRIVARLEPQKGIVELLQSQPPTWQRPVELVLAAAGFEYWPGMQDDLLATCRTLAARRPEVRLLDALPWHEVPAYLAGASATVIPSTSPETFGLVALEAMSVGTPVITFDLGHLPALLGDAGGVVPLTDGATHLWEATDTLLNTPSEYRRMSRAGPTRAQGYSPNHAAHAFLTATSQPA